jgi:hypothetical protein
MTLPFHAADHLGSRDDPPCHGAHLPIGPGDCVIPIYVVPWFLDMDVVLLIVQYLLSHLWSCMYAI